MERPELLRKIHELKAQQITNKKEHNLKLESISDVNKKLEDEEKMIWKEAEEKHRERVQKIRDSYKKQVAVQKEEYTNLQKGIEDKILELKCDYFKDHEFEPIY